MVSKEIYEPIEKVVGPIKIISDQKLYMSYVQLRNRQFVIYNKADQSTFRTFSLSNKYGFHFKKESYIFRSYWKFIKEGRDWYLESDDPYAFSNIRSWAKPQKILILSPLRAMMVSRLLKDTKREETIK